MIYDLKFLESIENVKLAVLKTVGREPSTMLAREISVCLRQGRLYFESAKEASLEIRPLILYYGILAYARAVIVARTLRSLATLNQTHGLLDKSKSGTSIAELQLEIGARGTFQEFNDSIRGLSAINYFADSTPTSHAIPSAESSCFNGMRVSLKQILGRIPWLDDHYQRTFQEHAKTNILSLFAQGSTNERTELRIDLPNVALERSALRQAVCRMRENFPCLRRWTLSTVQEAWGNAVLIFENLARDEVVDDLSDEVLQRGALGFRTTLAPSYVNFLSLLEPVSPSGQNEHSYLVSGLGGYHMSEISLEYLGMFILSSLVRYRPDVWVHAVSRFSYAERPADDRALTLIEHFLDLVQGRFPNIVSLAIIGK
jgi:hypothetical protein